MPLLDLAVTILVGAFAVLGFARGFVRGALDLLLFAAAAALAARLYRPAATVLIDGGLDPGLGPAVGFAAVFLGAMFLGALALRVALAPARVFPWPPPLPFLNRLLGLGPGVVKGVIAAGIVLAPLSALRDEYRMTRLFAESRLAPALAAAAARVADDATGGHGLDPVGLPGLPDALPGLPDRTTPPGG